MDTTTDHFTPLALRVRGNNNGSSKRSLQVLLDEVDKEKTAFTSLLGLLQFKVMAFGLIGATATFQRLMDNILQGTEEYAGVYLDDIIVYGKTWEEDRENVKKVSGKLVRQSN